MIKSINFIILFLNIPVIIFDFSIYSIYFFNYFYYYFSYRSYKPIIHDIEQLRKYYIIQGLKRNHSESHYYSVLQSNHIDNLVIIFFHYIKI
jgi:hypothetical protein